MNLELQKSKSNYRTESKLTEANQQSLVKITGSKSETNRLLLLQALYSDLYLENTSNSDDSEVMRKAMQRFQNPLYNNHCVEINVCQAGTAMRFLTAYFAIQEGAEVLLTGSLRMKERPIEILVKALNQLGADISYLEKEGFPPIRIKGKKLLQKKVTLPATVSSQYISALIKVNPTPNTQHPILLTIESDWSSASYWFSIVALSEIGMQITLSSYKKNSLQGDSILVQIYKDFGVQTVFNEDQSITISKINSHNIQYIEYNLQSTPDIAQTIVVTCFGLGIACNLKGLQTLKIKETDRLEALKIELTKLGSTIAITKSSLSIEESKHINSDIEISTYQDHRMAMAFAPLALKVPIQIKNAEVVSKSYPNFWKDLELFGIAIKELY